MAFAQCPKGHDFAQKGKAYRVSATSEGDLSLIAGWVVIFCTECGHVYQINPPTAAPISQRGV